MPQARHILAIDQGTTSTRAIVFDGTGRLVSIAQREFGQHFPADGWVEHDAEEIWRSTVDVCRRALDEASASGGEVGAIGITNQRETVVVWDRGTGAPVCRAIVWQDRRTADACERLARDGHEAMVREKTGLLLDPYFSATKLAWILDNVAGARRKAEAGALAFGTTDSFLLWRLTEGRVHATDATNASRTLLYNIHTGEWDEALLELFDIPASLLPEVRDCADDYGTASAAVLGRALPIGGVAGDQQAATIGQACFEPGMVKSTYGTGAFVVMNTGAHPHASRSRLLTTIAYRIGGRVSYALEGSIFVAGAAVQWLRDGLGLIDSAAQTEVLAASLESNRGVYLVPAFTGLGAPYWDPHARGALFGLTRDTRPAALARAALEAVCYQTDDLLRAMASDAGEPPAALRVDGGMAGNDWMMQFLADVSSLPVERPVVTETTALGAAYLAGLHTGVFTSLEALSAHWKRDRRFEPRMEAAARERLIEGWRRAVSRVTGSGVVR